MPDPTTNDERPPEVIAIEGEPGWAHVWTTTPRGTWEPIADLHLACGRAKAYTQRQPDGTNRHVCRACAIDAAVARQEA